MITLVSLCDNSSALNAIYLAKTAISIITIVVPIVLIVSLMILIVKYITTHDDDFLIKLKSSAINRIISALVVFLVPLGVNILLETLNTGSDFKTCYSNANADYIAQRKQEEKIEKEIEKRAREQELALKQQQSSSNSSNNSGSQNTTKYASEIVYYNQGDYSTTYLCSSSNGKTIKSSGCGHTSLSMIAATFGNKKYTPVDIRNIMCGSIGKSLGYEYGALGDWFYTNSTLLNELGLESETLINHNDGYKTYNSSYASSILTAVQSGKGVIIYIPGHYVVVGQNPSCTTNQVYYYDPGNRSNRGCYTMNELWNKTYNYSSRCTNNNNCGWKGAWAFVGK